MNPHKYSELQLENTQDNQSVLDLEEMADEKLSSGPNLVTGGDPSSYNSGEEVRLDHLQRAIMDYIALNQHKPIKFVPTECGVALPNSKLWLENTQDDPSVVTLDSELQLENTQDDPSAVTLEEMEDEKLPSDPNLVTGGDPSSYNSGEEVRLDQLQRAIRDYIALNPHKPIKFVKCARGSIDDNSGGYGR